jgi:hypothetical protein
MNLPASGTLLMFEEIGAQPLFSSRGAEQTFELIEQNAPPEYDINGDLIDMSLPQFSLYRTRITCRDQRPPANDGIFRGKLLTVHCAAFLQRKTGDAAARPVVSGSEFTNGAYVMYRPKLVCRLADMANAWAEWEAQNSWTMTLLEKRA